MSPSRARQVALASAGPSGGGGIFRHLGHTSLMGVNFADFAADLTLQGYDEVLERRWEPGSVVESHAHAFDAKALVVQGEMWLTEQGKTRHILSGGTFELPAGTPHVERYGPEGATYWVGRRFVEAGTHTGGCLCGGVRYSLTGPLEGVVACHCSQCRRTSGHHAAMTRAPTQSLAITRADSLVWYRSSAAAERGFCNVCGGNLFWRALQGDAISITAGTLDAPTGVHIEQHIFVADKPDYYGLDDGVAQFEQGS